LHDDTKGDFYSTCLKPTHNCVIQHRFQQDDLAEAVALLQGHQIRLFVDHGRCWIQFGVEGHPNSFDMLGNQLIAVPVGLPTEINIGDYLCKVIQNISPYSESLVESNANQILAYLVADPSGNPDPDYYLVSIQNFPNNGGSTGSANIIVQSPDLDDATSFVYPTTGGPVVTQNLGTFTITDEWDQMAQHGFAIGPIPAGGCVYYAVEGTTNVNMVSFAYGQGSVLTFGRDNKNSPNPNFVAAMHNKTDSNSVSFTVCAPAPAQQCPVVRPDNIKKSSNLNDVLAISFGSAGVVMVALGIFGAFLLYKKGKLPSYQKLTTNII